MYLPVVFNSTLLYLQEYFTLCFCTFVAQKEVMDLTRTLKSSHWLAEFPRVKLLESEYASLMTL